jgi:hypothetical protein
MEKYINTNPKRKGEHQAEKTRGVQRVFSARRENAAALRQNKSEGLVQKNKTILKRITA